MCPLILHTHYVSHFSMFAVVVYGQPLNIDIVETETITIVELHNLLNQRDEGKAG